MAWRIVKRSRGASRVVGRWGELASPVNTPRNDVSGTAGNVVQAGEIHGGVHLHLHPAPDPGLAEDLRPAGESAGRSGAVSMNARVSGGGSVYQAGGDQIITQGMSEG
jgi:hypothetical protein